MIKLSKYAPVNDVILAGIIYGCISLVFVFLMSIDSSSHLSTEPRHFYAFFVTLIPFSMAVVMFKGFNAKMILLLMTFCVAFEYLVFDAVQDYVSTGEASNMFRLHGPLISLLPVALLMMFRVQISMKIATFLYRFTATRGVAIELIKNVRVTRLDIYILIANVGYLLVTFAYYANAYLFYAGLGGPWHTFNDFIEILIANDGINVNRWRYAVYDLFAAFEATMVIFTCFREYHQPDGLYLTKSKNGL